MRQQSKVIKWVPKICHGADTVPAPTAVTESRDGGSCEAAEQFSLAFLRWMNRSRRLILRAGPSRHDV
jgi:hypothetical protein